MQNQGQSSTLKLGSTLTVGTCLTPSIILDLQKKIPDLDVYSFVTNTQNIEQKLLRSELDAAVVEGEIHSPDLIVLPIIDDCLVLAAGKKHPFYRRGRIHVQELNNQKFAVREYGSGTRQLFEDYTLRHDLKIRTAWEANSPRALLNAVLYNQMLSVMSIRLMHHEIRHRSVRVFCNEAGEWNRKFKLVYHKNKFLTPAIFELEKILLTYQQLELPSVMGVLEQE
jgi:Transcriptional regulator